MRVFPLASTVAIGLVLGLPSSSHADEPSAEQLQARLVQTRVDLNRLYQQSAAASERLNGARYRLAQAEEQLARERSEARATKAELTEQSSVVADLTVRQLQNNTGVAHLQSLISSHDPMEMLERASAYESTAEAMTSTMDELSARQTVHRAAAEQLAAAQERQRSAVARQAAAERAIADAIERAEATADQTERKRAVLLAQLAAAKNESLAVVEQRQAAIDARIDDGPPADSTDVPPTTEAPVEQPAPEPPAPEQSAPEQSAPIPSASGGAAAAIAFAQQQLGEPYAWGGDGPDRWDCSGLVMRAWEAAGVRLPHYAGAQYSHSRPVPMDSIEPGDLLFWGKKPTSASHVAIYLGNDRYIHAPRPGRNVEIRTFAYWVKPTSAARPAA